VEKYQVSNLLGSFFNVKVNREKAGMDYINVTIEGFDPLSLALNSRDIGCRCTIV